MKSILREFIELSEEDKKALWSRATFIFDTNILLNLYRYSLKTREALLNSFESLKDNIWIPYNVAHEFMNKRCDVICEINERYETISKEIPIFKSQILKYLRLSENDNDVKELEKYINNWLKNNKEKNLLKCEFSNDPILDKLFLYFDEKTGFPFSDAELKKIKEEGKGRFENNIPPGYKDSKKKDGENDNNMYGDLIIWKQILNYARENKKDIIFITQDQKIDWWNIVHGKTIGPRFELRKEFYDFTEQLFHMYSMDSFLDYIDKQRGVDIEQSVIDEVKSYDKVYMTESVLKRFEKLTDREKKIFINHINDAKLFRNNTYHKKSIDDVAKDYYINKLETEAMLNRLRKEYDEEEISKFEEEQFRNIIKEKEKNI